MTINYTPKGAAADVPAVMPSSGYTYVKQYAGKPKPVKAIIIGAGVTGIGAVKIFKDMIKDEPIDLTIYEKNEDVGGTWLENRYPGYVMRPPAVSELL
jgi:hypothetical protein